MTPRLKPVKDQVLVVTGASSGIGLVTARMAAKEGTLPLLKEHLRQAQQIAGSVGIDTVAR